ncbi:hypothetical protein [Bacillus sp. PK3_68]|uniref:hypothetical protein n=1 Tax=Bacillus sp. PK3_68 TaxID=2027408 RepID=UPI000E748B17|nr:hypothetical protein [Bacillus sp. PK3_68]RJS59993.1 hypothetical protein CJ483_07790 [Bacillus sp. PK3_68]
MSRQAQDKSFGRLLYNLPDGWDCDLEGQGGGASQRKAKPTAMSRQAQDKPFGRLLYNLPGGWGVTNK